MANDSETVNPSETSTTIPVAEPSKLSMWELVVLVQKHETQLTAHLGLLVDFAARAREGLSALGERIADVEQLIEGGLIDSGFGKIPRAAEARARIHVRQEEKRDAGNNRAHD